MSKKKKKKFGRIGSVIVPAVLERFTTETGETVVSSPTTARFCMAEPKPCVEISIEQDSGTTFVVYVDVKKLKKGLEQALRMWR